MIGLLRYVLAILVSSFGSNIRLEAENAALKLLYAFVIVCLQGPCLDQHQRINLSSWCACQARGRPRRCSAPLRLAARISDITCLVWPAGRPVAATSPHPSTTRTSYSARCVRWTSWSTLPAHATAQPTYGALNPQSIWIIVVLVMAISAAGYIAVRILGDRFGLALAGLASGFIPVSPQSAPWEREPEQLRPFWVRRLRARFFRRWRRSRKCALFSRPRV